MLTQRGMLPYRAHVCSSDRRKTPVRHQLGTTLPPSDRRTSLWSGLSVLAARPDRGFWLPPTPPPAEPPRSETCGRGLLSLSRPTAREPVPGKELRDGRTTERRSRRTARR